MTSNRILRPILRPLAALLSTTQGTKPVFPPPLVWGSLALSLCLLSFGVSAQNVDPVEKPESKPVEEKVSPAKEKLPNVKLTDEILFKILMSEIAVQRGNWQASYVTLYTLAQQTRDPRIARRAAEIALNAKQSTEGMAAVRLWRDLSPDSEEAQQYYLGFMVMFGNYAEIEKHFAARLKEVKPEQQGAIMLQAQRGLMRAKDKALAFKSLEKILAPYNETADAHVALAQAAFSMGKQQVALNEARLALQKKPDSQLAVLNVAQAVSKEEAIKELEAFLKNNPTATDVRHAYAGLLIDTKQILQAYQEFKGLNQARPDDPGILYTYAALSIELGNVKEAEALFKRHLQILENAPTHQSDPTGSLMNLSRIATINKDYDAAEEWLAKIDSFEGRNPYWFNAQLRRAHLLARQNKLEQARAILQSLSSENEEEKLQVIQTEAQLLKEKNRYAEASELLENALKTRPENADLLYDLAMLAELQKKYDEMETHLRKVIKVAPNNHHAYNALGYSFADRNINLKEALELIEKANAMAPEDPYILDSLGWVKFRLERYQEAEEILRRAYTMRQDAEIAIHLGEVLWVKGQQGPAREMLREAELKDPDNPILRSTLQRLNLKP